jgi:hypothetical protein
LFLFCGLLLPRVRIFLYTLPSFLIL